MTIELEGPVTEDEFEVKSGRVYIRGAWCAADHAGRLPAVIILHGIPRSKPVPGDVSYRDMARLFAGRGFLSVIFNFRGTGESGGDISMAGWVKDLHAVLGFTRSLERADPERIALLGFSAGGAVAIRVAAEDRGVAAVAAVSTPAEFTFLQRTMPGPEWVALFREIGLIRSPGFPPLIEEWEAEFDEIAPLRWVGLLYQRPLLIMHGDQDEVIPLGHARELYAIAREPRDLIIIPGGQHRLRVDPRAVSAALEWLSRWKDASIAKEQD
jgi:fermentation-respiration switch protein FrsA (DUF1100 family)